MRAVDVWPQRLWQLALPHTREHRTLSPEVCFGSRGGCALWQEMLLGGEALAGERRRGEPRGTQVAVVAGEHGLALAASRAAEKGVRLMVDAEQTYFQPAIDNSIYGLQERYNSGLDPNSGKHRFTIFGTHQCYLKDAGARLRRDLKRAHKKGYNFATK